MKQFIIELLNTLGLGVYGIMPCNVDNLVGRLQSFAPSFSISVIENKEDTKVLNLYASETEQLKIKYIHQGARIVKIEVS